jgi:hypothetical protein
VYSATLLGGGELARREQGCALCACAGFSQRFLSPDLRLRCQLLDWHAGESLFFFSFFATFYLFWYFKLLSVFSSD